VAGGAGESCTERLYVREKEGGKRGRKRKSHKERSQNERERERERKRESERERLEGVRESGREEVRE